MARRIIKTIKNKDGVLDKFLLEGNSNFTSKKKIVEMAENGNIQNVLVCVSVNNKKYVKSKPDKFKGNNLGEMAD